jgi:hypothetical protein
MISGAKTVVRVRPFTQKRTEHDGIYNIVRMQQKEKAVLLTDPNATNRKSRFACDYCLDSFKPPLEAGYASQDIVWQTIGREVVADALGGFNTSVIAYGQTGTGKSYTMFNDDGLVIKIAEEIQRRGKRADGDKFYLLCSVVELYNETLVDLFSREPGFNSEYN